MSKGPIERTADRTDVDSAVLADRIEAVLLDAVALPETQPKPKPTPAGAQRPKLLVRKAASREYCCAALRSSAHRALAASCGSQVSRMCFGRWAAALSHR